MSGLESAIRSGYDAQLLVEIALNDPYHADLPMDRVGLYNKAIEVGWPDVPPNLRRDQQGRLMAAAWGMVSERKPNEDSTRLKPGNDLSRDLLEALADVPAKESKSIRLVRRVGAEEFEFVREQMQAYLAARWFTQDVFDLDDLERLVENSTVWMQGSDARRILWGFVSALLDNYRLVALLQRIEEVEKWDSLRRALRTEAIQRLLI